MAKKTNQTKKPADKPAAKRAATSSREATPSTVSYSTRLNQRQRKMIDDAAKLKQWSPAQFIREAALTRAVEILNAAEPGMEYGLRRSAQIVAKQLVRPATELEFWSEATEFPVYFKNEGTVVLFGSSEDQHEVIEMFDPQADGLSYRPAAPSATELIGIRKALESCSTVFIELILSRWQDLEANYGEQYEPTHDIAEILGGVPEVEEASETGAAD